MTNTRKILLFLIIICLIGIAAYYLLPKPSQSLSCFLREIVTENPHSEMRVYENAGDLIKESPAYPKEAGAAKRKLIADIGATSLLLSLTMQGHDDSVNKILLGMLDMFNRPAASHDEGALVFRYLTLRHEGIDESGKHLLVNYHFTHFRFSPGSGPQVLICNRYRAGLKDDTRNETIAFYWTANSPDGFMIDGVYHLKKETPDGVFKTDHPDKDFDSNWDKFRDEIKMFIKNGWYAK